MEEIPKHLYKKQWYKVIEFNIEPLTDVFKKVGEKIFRPHKLDFHQFLFITEGEADHEVDFNRIKLRKNTILPLVEGQVQQYKKHQNIEGFVIVFTSGFIIHDELSLRYLLNFSIFNTIQKPLELSCDKEVAQLIEMLYHTFINKNEFAHEELLRSYLKLILLKLEQIKQKQVDVANTATVAISLKFNQALDKHVNYNTKVSDLCNFMNVDRKKVSEAIKSTTNQTPKQLLDERIVLELKRLLAYTDLAIKEVANQLGFEETSNFTNYFKRKVGLTPSEFRRALID